MVVHGVPVAGASWYTSARVALFNIGFLGSVFHPGFHITGCAQCSKTGHGYPFKLDGVTTNNLSRKWIVFLCLASAGA